MNDLIERLRLCERNGKRHVGELACEAADEIERLTEYNDTLEMLNLRLQARVEELSDE